MRLFLQVTNPCTGDRTLPYTSILIQMVIKILQTYDYFIRKPAICRRLVCPTRLRRPLQRVVLIDHPGGNPVADLSDMFSAGTSQPWRLFQMGLRRASFLVKAASRIQIRGVLRWPAAHGSALHASDKTPHRVLIHKLRIFIPSLETKYYDDKIHLWQSLRT